MHQFSVPAVASVGDAANLTDPVWDNAARAPGAAQFARRDGDGWQEVTCARFRDEVVRVAAGLIAAGLRPGDRVGLLSGTRYEWTVIDYAIWAAGLVSVPVYDTSSPEQITWILADSGAVACFVETAAHRRSVEAARGELADLAQVWQIGAGALDELAAAGAEVDAAEVERRRGSVRAGDLATVIYTSGTTGRPKGCMLTHRNVCTDIANAMPALSELFHEGASTLLFLPLAHSFARLIQLGAVASRTRMGHLPDIHNLADELARFRPTFLLGVPRVFEKVYLAARQRAHAENREAVFDWAERTAIAYSQALDTRRGPSPMLRLRHRIFDRLVYRRLRAAIGGRCRHAISGGAPLGPHLGHFFRGIGLLVFEGYGLTETSPAVAVNREGAMRIGTVGRPLPGVTVRIADDGEVLINGDVVFTGYWNNPQATAEVLDEDGWFRTGDLGDLDEDGFLSITGRKKEIIVTAGGKNVVPAVLEDRLRAHPLISQCMVVGDRKPFIGALITIDEDVWPTWLAEHGRPPGTSVAELREDEQLRADLQAAVDEANRAASRAEAIKVFRVLPHDWTEQTGEVTPSLKVKRSVVLKEYAEEIAAIYAR